MRSKNALTVARTSSLHLKNKPLIASMPFKYSSRSTQKPNSKYCFTKQWIDDQWTPMSWELQLPLKNILWFMGMKDTAGNTFWVVPAVKAKWSVHIQLYHFIKMSYHQWQLIGVPRGTRKGCQARPDLVVTVTTPDRQHCDVPELICLVHPLLPNSGVEIYTSHRRFKKRNQFYISSYVQ